MMIRLPGLQVVSLASPYDTWKDPRVQQLFCRTLEMRLAGYGSEYGSGVFPLDGADFIGAHHLVCEKGEQGLTPIMGFRTTSWGGSRRHGLPFGGMSLVRGAGATAHAQALEKILDHCEAHSIPIAYIASWTMDPRVRQDPKLRPLLRDLFMALAVWCHAEAGIRVIGGCTMRFKVDQWFAGWGFEPLRQGGVDLPPVQVPFLLGESVRVMYLKRFSEAALAHAARFEGVWRNRIVIDAPASVGVKKAA